MQLVNHASALLKEDLSLRADAVFALQRCVDISNAIKACNLHSLLLLPFYTGALSCASPH
jgi:hypothetical protein